MKTADAGIHQKRGSQVARPTAISTAAQSRTNLNASRTQPPKRAAAVALVRLVVAALPPKGERRTGR